MIGDHMLIWIDVDIKSVYRPGDIIGQYKNGIYSDLFNSGKSMKSSEPLPIELGYDCRQD
jgi:hypothetical protein